MMYDDVTNQKLSELIGECRDLLSQYRYNTRGQQDTVFIGQIEIVVALADFIVREGHVLSLDEKKWFSKNFLLHYAFDGTDYDKMIQSYDHICWIINHDLR